MRKPSIIDVANVAGVGKSTVSRVLNGDENVNEETRRLVNKTLKELKYKVNISARNLKSMRNNTIAMLIDKSDVFMGTTTLVNNLKIAGVVDAGKKHNYNVIMLIEDLANRKEIIRIIRDKDVSGILLLSPVEEEILLLFEEYNIPFVLINWVVPGKDDYIFVKTDLSYATELALNHLFQKGYKDIGIISWEDKWFGGTWIRDSAKAVFEKYGVDFENALFEQDNAKDLTEEKLFEYLDSSNKKCFLCFSYASSLSMIKYCRLRGLSIPKDFAFLTYEFFEFFDYLHPIPTGIEQNLFDMSVLATKKLIEMIIGDRKVHSEYVKTNLVIGESC